jgi:hypothetical protein
MNCEAPNLTREQVEHMPAGRELDELVAKRVMEWRRSGTPGRWSHDANRQWSVEERQLPHYSTKLTAAWKVVQLLSSQGWLYTINGGNRGESAIVVFRKVDGYDVSSTVAGSGRTVELAICRVALLASLEGSSDAP